jgi:hypothetical protein
MRWAWSCLPCVFAVALNAGCGRVGVEVLSDQETDPAMAAEDAAEPEDAEPDEEPAGSEDSGGEDEPETGAASDAESDFDASLTDAGARDAAFDAAADAARADAGPNDASAREAAVDAAPPACQLGAGDTGVNYALGELAKLQGTHLLSVAQSGLCALPRACSVAPAQDVLQASCSVSTCQMWTSIDAGGDSYYLRNAKSGLCMAVADSGDGTRLTDAECSDDDHLRWQLTCAGGNAWRLINRASNLPLSASGTSANSAIVQSAQAADAAQRWTITSNPAAYTVVMSDGERDENASWRYTTSAPGGSWMQTSFDDSAWSTGPGGFGSAARGFTPARTDWSSRDIWLRRNFALSSLPANLTVAIFHDEAAELYINGNLVVQLSGSSSGYEAIDVPPAVLSGLVVGSNLITMHSQSLSSPQFLDLGLLSYSWR